MTTRKNPDKQLRYERKYIAKESSSSEVDLLLRRHPAMFSEIYQPRQINTIYFDTFDWRHYRDNLAGAARRKKIRIRWYGSITPVKDAKLEVKHKLGFLVYKDTFDLDNFSIDEAGHINLEQHNQINLKQVRPVVMNTYTRKYFLSRDEVFRATLDTKLAFYNTDGKSFSNIIDTNPQVSILELKYNPQADEVVENITRHLPFRLARSSKYIMGVQACYRTVR